MSKLRADIDNLNTAISMFDDVSTDIDILVKKLEGVVAELDSTWDGAASKEYINRLKTQINNLKAVKKPIGQLSYKCQSVAEQLVIIDKLINSITKTLNSIVYYR